MAKEPRRERGFAWGRGYPGGSNPPPASPPPPAQPPPVTGGQPPFPDLTPGQPGMGYEGGLQPGALGAPVWVGTAYVNGQQVDVFQSGGKFYTETGQQVSGYRPYGQGEEPPGEEPPGEEPPIEDEQREGPPGWIWDGEKWVEDEDFEDPEEAAAKAKHENDLFALYRSTLEQFGFTGTDVEDFLKQSVKEDWNASTFTIKMRQTSWYLANPLFAANIANAATGKRFMAEGEVIAYASEAKRLARQFGFVEPSDNYIANGLSGGLSMAEYEHRFAVQQRVNLFGAGVGVVYREIMGHDPSDQDLYEIFDNEISTQAFDDAARQAEMRGRPLTLGLGIRTEAEARAAEMLGITPDEWFSRFEGVAQNAPRFDRLRAVEDLIAQGLPDDFGSHLMTAENGLLIQALVFQRPDALAKLQTMTSREIARFRQGSGAVATQGGQQVGLLSQAERASFG